MPPLHLSTILAHKPSALLSHISHISKDYAGKGHTVLFALSSNFTLAQDLQVVVDRLTKFNDIDDIGTRTNATAKGRTIGCLADNFTPVTFEGLPINTKSVDEPLLSCSIGIFDSNLCVPFHSTLHGRAQPQVGRWHSFRNKDSKTDGDRVGEKWEPDWQHMNTKEFSNNKGSETNWEDIWNRSLSSSSSSTELLPETLRGIDPSEIDSLFTLSSLQPDALTHLLSNSLPTAASLTVMAAPTHFITGRGVTLFLDGQIFGDGAVGIALLNKTESTQEKRMTCRTEFLGVNRLLEPMTVTSREGNMINELNSSNPTKLLLGALDLAGFSPSSHVPSTSGRVTTFKDDETFALGVLGSNNEILSTYKITAGDPSSRGGSLSLEASTAPNLGSVVQFLRFSSSSPIEIPASYLPEPPVPANAALPTKQVLAVFTVPELPPSPTANLSSTEPDSHTFNNAFLVPSTQGFVLSRGQSIQSRTPEDAVQSSQEESPWTCSLPGGAAFLEWK